MSDADSALENKTIGIIGGGQLAQMLASSVRHLRIKCTVLDPNPNCCATNKLGQCDQIVAHYDDEQALIKLAQSCDVVTYEFENVPGQGAALIASHGSIHPNPTALSTSQDRLSERAMFKELNIPVPPFAQVDSLNQLSQGLEKLGAPSILKARTLGYDGKGQVLISDPAMAAKAWETLGKVPAILDSFIEFDRELSIIATRALNGHIEFYPLSENIHRGGILRLTKAPARQVHETVASKARDSIQKILEHFDYVGTLAVEFFQVGQGAQATLLANEIAPRVHNSGHWTIEGARTSQFQNHMRAVLGMELGSAEPTGHSAMINLIGNEPRPGSLGAMPKAHIHLYGKEPRPGRKIGHITLNAKTQHELDAMLERFTRIIG
ncbi:MAG: 5-(carboxyamino)imidazole ribonucleotide synthase [Phycisphaerales bacterium]|nr:5-(carboxyamino)imidazole ribonucleotide synthase [Phycisphaerales bacterium]